MNGEPLPKEHGYPLRAIVPGIYGMKNVKWLSKISLVRYDYKGYWQKKGWSDAAVIPIKSQILMPMDGKKIKLGDYVIGGVAFAGRYGIGGVQVSLDGGKTWHMADMKPPLSKWAWVLWRYGWKPARKGKYKIVVRGIDKAGKVQEKGGLFEKSLSEGAKGYHTVKVKVV
jgi:DMSO/TMAO reductase YedYZ molybdopterin-dependent catalytic subunit